MSLRCIFDERESVLLGELACQEYLLPMEDEDYANSANFQKGAGTLLSDMSEYGLSSDPKEDEDHAR